MGFFSELTDHLSLICNFVVVLDRDSNIHEFSRALHLVESDRDRSGGSIPRSARLEEEEDEDDLRERPIFHARAAADDPWRISGFYARLRETVVKVP